MILEETSIAEKLIKLFPHENIVLNKKFNKKTQIFGLKIMILLLKLTKEIMKIMIQMMKKKEKTCLKIILLKFLRCNPSNPEFDLSKFLREIVLYILKFREENAVNGVINKITEDFEKIVAVTKSKELKRYTKNILPNYKK